ncbi:MAG: hypothetical protein IKT17_00500, partial [Lachnospiraceae bacterium]|nr:hypothetical protein [Lachnospiraceae bacterium]
MMKRNIGRILTGLMTAVMVLTSMPVGVFAAEPGTDVLISSEREADDISSAVSDTDALDISDINADLPDAVSEAPGEEGLFYADLSDYIIQAGGFPKERISRDNALAAKDLEGALDAIYAGLKKRASSISVSKYGISGSDVADVYYSVVNAHPELFYCQTGLSWRTSGSSVTYILPYYTDSYTDQDIVAFDNKVKKIMSGVDGSWSSLEKALYLHEYLVTHCDYDTTYSNYDAYNAIVQEWSVCQGYALAYEYLLQLAGIDGQVVTSDYNNHAWNLLKLDGKWYFVDCTWDDPVGTNDPDYCRHTNFLRSAAGMTETGHKSNDWIGGETRTNVYSISTGTGYDTFFWSDYTGAVRI